MHIVLSLTAVLAFSVYGVFRAKENTHLAFFYGMFGFITLLTGFLILLGAIACRIGYEACSP